MHQVIEWGGLALAVVGSGLGIYNTLQNRRKDRERLRVEHVFLGRHNMQTGEDEPVRLCIQVTNMSTFPIVVSAVGFYAGKKDWVVLMMPVDVNGDRLRWPCRLERGESVVIRTEPELADNPSYPRIRGVFANTSTGRKFLNKQKRLRQHVAGETMNDETSS